MRLILRCKLDLDALIRCVKLTPTILEQPPKLEIDGGVVQFDTPNEVIEWLKEALKHKQT